MLAWCTNNEVGRIWKEAVTVMLMYAHYRSICLEGLRNIMKSSVKLALSEHKAEAVVDFRSSGLLGNTE